MFIDSANTPATQLQDSNEDRLRNATKNPEDEKALDSLYQSVGITSKSEDSKLALKQRSLLDTVFRKMGMLKDNQLTAEEIDEVSTLTKGSSSEYPAMVSNELSALKENSQELAYQNPSEDTEAANDSELDLRSRLESMTKGELSAHARDVRYSTSKHGDVNEFIANASDEELTEVFGDGPSTDDAEVAEPSESAAPANPDDETNASAPEPTRSAGGSAGGAGNGRDTTTSAESSSSPASSEPAQPAAAPNSSSASGSSAPEPTQVNDTGGPASANALKRSEPVVSVTKSQPAPSGNVVYEDGYDGLPNGTPSIGDERAYRDQIGYNPLYIKGFGADSQVDGSSDQRGREAAGQVNGASDQVRVSAQDGTIKVIYPKGGNTSSHSGLQYQDQIPGTPDRDGPGENPPLDEVTMNYKVKFEKDFPWQGGGKLPGVIASDGFGGKDDLSSLRLMWRANGKLEFYIHTPHEDRTRLPFDNVDGTHAAAPDGEWMDVQLRVKLNTVNNGKPQADGVLEAWIDGKRVAFYDDVKIRGNEDTNINSMFFSTFYGGSSGDGSTQWWPPRDSSAEFKDVTITK